MEIGKYIKKYKDKSHIFGIEIKLNKYNKKF